jgi:hypothetical protein
MPWQVLGDSPDLCARTKNFGDPGSRDAHDLPLSCDESSIPLTPQDFPALNHVREYKLKAKFAHVQYDHFRVQWRD